MPRDLGSVCFYLSSLCQFVTLSTSFPFQRGFFSVFFWKIKYSRISSILPLATHSGCHWCGLKLIFDFSHQLEEKNKRFLLVWSSREMEEKNQFRSALINFFFTIYLLERSVEYCCLFSNCRFLWIIFFFPIISRPFFWYPAGLVI
jgi:hypothetical protein